MVGSLLAASMATAAVGVGLASAGPKGAKADPVGAQAISPFMPSKITVKPGQIVYFKNLDGAPHNAVSLTRVGGKVAFTSGSPTTSGTFRFKAPMKKGTYKFHCQVHSVMTGTLVVK
jgi:plastocyanin